MASKIIAALLLLFLFPLLLLISLIMFFQTGRNPFFVQVRGLTLSKYRFKIYKFRTLNNSKNIVSNLCTLKKTTRDGCIYPFGKFLRKTGLDELPQLLNIIKGEMNFVGPRPLDLKDLENIKNHFYEHYSEREKIDFLPGVTGYWQIKKDENRSIKNLIELDKYYNDNQTLKLDIKIIYVSIALLLKAKHKDSINEESYKFDKLGNDYLSLAKINTKIGLGEAIPL